MRLADFILTEMEAILAEWETFAASMLPAAAHMTPLALRNHAQHILEAVAKDLTTPQTPLEQAEKAKGHRAAVRGAPETAAQTHAVLRARSGFDINQLVAEYRALRASVLRLWLAAGPNGGPQVEEIVRFNEAIDQAIAESVGHFHKHVERARNLLLGMLGHDMRTPLNAIVTTASYLAALQAGDQVSVAAERLIRSCASIQTLLDDLVDFNRTSLGLGLKVVPTHVDLAAELTDELEQLRGAYRGRQIELATTGDSQGRWDAGRLKQLLRNLVSNAIKYGAVDTPVRVALIGETADIRLEVSNRGPAIDPSVRAQMFDPLSRGPAPVGTDDSPSSLGLGLFIVREIVDAHGGEVDARSGGGETVFVVRLPRR